MFKAITTRLQAKLILAFVLVLLIPTAVSAIYSLNSTYNQAVATAREAELSNNLNKTAQIEALLNRVKADTLFLSNSTVTKNYADSLNAIDPVVTEKALAEMESVFLALSDSVDIFDQVRFIDARGQEIVNAELHDGKPVLLPPNLLENKADREYFKPSMSLPPGGLYISPFDLNQKAGKIEVPHKPVVRFSSPVFDDNNRIRGFVIVSLLAKNIQDLVYGDVKGEEAYLVDSDGNYLSGPDINQLYNRDLNNGFVFQKDHPKDAAGIISGDYGTFFGSADRPDQFQIYSHIKLAADAGSVNWILYHTQPTASILSTVYQTQGIVVAIAVISLLFAIGLAFFITRGIVRPVNQLAVAAGAVSKGNWDTPVPDVGAKDEIGQLTSAFSTMTHALRNSYETQEKARKEIERRAGELETVAKVSAATSTILNIEELLQQVSDLTKSSFNLYHAHVYLVDNESQSLVLAAGAGDVGRTMKARGFAIPLNREQSLVARAARTAKGVIINDVRQEPGFLPNPLLSETRSEMAIPMKVAGHVVGVLDVQSELANRFDEEDIRIQAALADQIAVAVENARSFGEINDREDVIESSLREAQLLAQTNSDLSQAGTEDEILRVLAEMAAQHSAANAAFFYVETDANNEVLGLRTVSGRTADGKPIPLSAFPKTFLTKEDFPILDLIFANPDEPLFIEDARTDPRFEGGIVREYVRTMGMTALIVMPLKTGDTWQGLVSFWWSEPQKFDWNINQLFKAIIPTASAVTASRRAAIAQEAARQESEQRAAELEAVAKVSAATSSIMNIDELLQQVSDLTKSSFNLYHAHVYLMTEDNENLVLAAGAGDVGRTMKARGFTIPLNREQSLVARAARSGHGVIINDVRQEPGFLPNPLLSETRSEMAIPMKVVGRVIGVLDVQSDQINRFDEDDIRVHASLADQIAVAVENTRSFDEITDREDIIESALRQAETLATFNGDLSRATTEAEILQTLSALAGHYSAAAAAFYYIETDEFDRVLGIRAAAGRTPDGVALSPSSFPRPYMSAEEFPLLSLIFDHPDMPLFVENTATDPLTTQGGYSEIVRAGNFAALVIIPLRTADKWQGMVSFRWTEAQSFSMEMRALFTAIIPTASAVTASRRAALAQEAALRRAETLATLNGALSRTESEYEILKTLADFAGGYSAANAALYYADTNENGDLIGITAAAGYTADGNPIPLSSFPKKSLTLAEFPVLDLIFANPDAPLFFETTDDPLLASETLQTFLKTLGMAAFSVIPLRSGDRWQGMISFRWSEPKTFSTEFREILTAVIPTTSAVTASRRAAIAQETARRESERRASELETVAMVSAATTTLLDTNELLQSVSDLTKESFNLYHAHIYLLDDAGENLVLAAGAGEPGRMMKEHGHTISIHRERSLVARAARSRVSVIVNDVQAEPDFLPNPLLPDTRSEMAIPIQVGEILYGVLDVQSEHLDRFNDSDALVKTTLADQVAIAVQNARLYEQEAQSAEQLRTVDRLKSEFLASMSHELRTPLNSIIGYAEVMIDGVDGELSDEAIEDVHAIHDSGQHLLSLINDILDLAKIEAGRMDLDRESVSVADVAEEVLRITNVLVKAKDVQIVADIEEGLPNAYADHVRLRQILNNLVSNAIKFTDKGEVRIKAAYDQKSNMIAIGVKDTGMGIAPENLKLVFEQFRQVDGSSARKASGTGMGLTITRHLINMHGGEIWVESNLGEGSTFAFTMPVVAETEHVAGD